VSGGHLVCPAGDVELVAPAAGWAGSATGYRRSTAVGEDTGAVHTGFVIGELDSGGFLPWHVHSYEESFYVVAGTIVVDTIEGSFRLSDGGYGVVPVGMPHRLRNDSEFAVRWAEMQAPMPRSAYADDTFLVPPPLVDEAVMRPEPVEGRASTGSAHVEMRPEPVEGRASSGAVPSSSKGSAHVVDVDVRDPRNRYFGRITPAQMDPAKQSQDLLEVTASMRTALLVYGGINVKMMVDPDLGAQLATMFMVQYDPDGATGPHDHPFEETYFFLEGQAEATFDGKPVVVSAGDIAWAGVGCAHSFRNLGGGPLRWLETQAPQPPRRYSYRFARDWNYLREVLK
jgi:mannose-6-phosphate isomerase-like protein (cupin superfamily)